MVSFKLFEFPTLKFEGNQYIFTIKVKGDSGINPTLVFSGISVKLIVDGVVKQNAGLLDDPSYITYDSENKAYIASLIIPNTDEYNNKIVKYEVVPSLSVVDPFSTENYEKDTYVDSFHEEFRKNYIITGERLITSKVSTIVFKLVDEECNTQTGIQTYRAAILTNASGQNLDNTLTPTEGIYAFVLDGYINSSYEVVGRYTINAQGKPSVMTDPVPSVCAAYLRVPGRRCKSGTGRARRSSRHRAQDPPRAPAPPDQSRHRARSRRQRNSRWRSALRPANRAATAW